MTASDQLPAGVAFVSAQGDGSYDSATGVWDLSDAPLAKGDVKTIAIRWISPVRALARW